MMTARPAWPTDGDILSLKTEKSETDDKHILSTPMGGSGTIQCPWTSQDITGYYVNHSGKSAERSCIILQRRQDPH